MDADPQGLDADFPVLGEPVAVELANTRYRDGSEVIDFLATPSMADAWFAASPTAAGLQRPGRWTRLGWEQLVVLRDATDDLFRSVVDGVVPDARSLAVVNDAASRARGHSELRWDTERGPTVVVRRDAGSSVDRVLGDIAERAIALVAGSAAGPLAVCANDDCSMLFVRQHHRRRWCHNSCGHRHRQAAYARRIREEQHAPSP